MNLTIDKMKLIKACRKKVKLKHILLFVIFIILLEYLGVFTHIYELDYVREFHYPLEGDILEYVSQLKSKQVPDVAPLNQYPYPFIFPNEEKCRDSKKNFINVRLLYVIKSAITNFEQRTTIRTTWGWEGRFSDVTIRRVFVLGVQPDKTSNAMQKILKENSKYKDIVQADFIDTYFNNTIKTMMGFQWVMENCAKAQFVMFVDDDMYVSTKNVLRFIKNPKDYPRYLERSLQPSDEQDDDEDSGSNTLMNLLYAGYVFFSAPFRQKFIKWYMPVEEYPFNKYPPYAAAGSYVVTFAALEQMYYTSMYTKHFRFDDVYLGIVAKKANLVPFHCEEFHFWKKSYNKRDYKYVISSHGYRNPNELQKVWNEQRSLGNA